MAPSDRVLGETLANSPMALAIAALSSATSPRASHLAFCPARQLRCRDIRLPRLFFGVIGVLVAPPRFHVAPATYFTIKIVPFGPSCSVTTSRAVAVSGLHSVVSSSGTARQLENELDARPVGAGVMFVRDDSCHFCPDHRRDHLRPHRRNTGGGGGPRGLGACSPPVSQIPGSWAFGGLGRAYGSVMMVVLPSPSCSSVVRFMKVPLPAPWRRQPSLQECPRGNLRGLMSCLTGLCILWVPL